MKKKCKNKNKKKNSEKFFHYFLKRCIRYISINQSNQMEKRSFFNLYFLKLYRKKDTYSKEFSFKLHFYSQNSETFSYSKYITSFWYWNSAKYSLRKCSNFQGNELNFLLARLPLFTFLEKPNYIISSHVR